MSSVQPLVACWLDPSIGEANAHLALKQRFEGVSNRIAKWHYFDCGDDFTNFVLANPNMKLVAIMNGGFARRLVAPVSDRDALHSVYVLCVNVDKCQNLKAEEPKVKGVFADEDTLFRQMSNDLRREFP